MSIALSWAEIGRPVHCAHAKINSLTSLFREPVNINLIEKYERILQDFLRDVSLNFTVKCSISKNLKGRNYQNTDTVRIYISDRKIELFFSEFFFTTELGSLISSGPLYSVFLVAHAADRYMHPLGVVSFEVGDCGHLVSISYSSNNPSSKCIPDLAFFLSGGYDNFRNKISNLTPFSKRSSKVVWRGSTSGSVRVGFETSTDVRKFARVHLVSELNKKQYAGLCDVKISRVLQSSDTDFENLIRNDGLIGDYVDQVDYQNFQSAIDIDGNSNAWSGLFCSLLCGCVVIKIKSEKSYRQWYYDKLIHQKNVLLVESNFSNLEEVVGLATNSSEFVRDIGRAGHQLASSMTFETEIRYAIDVVADSIRIGSL